MDRNIEKKSPAVNKIEMAHDVTQDLVYSIVTIASSLGHSQILSCSFLHCSKIKSESALETVFANAKNYKLILTSQFEELYKHDGVM